MPSFLSEAELEESLLHQFRALGYACANGDEIGPDGKKSERESYEDVVLVHRLEDAVHRLNPGLPIETRQEVVRRVLQSELPVLLEENRRLHRFLTDGVEMEYYGPDGELTAGAIRLVDWDVPEHNDWLVVNQFTVISGNVKRRPDCVVFLNGLPVAVIELKAPGSLDATLTGAFNQLQTYKSQIPALFRTNALLVTSDGLCGRVGSLSADEERFMPWRTTDGQAIMAKGLPEQATLIEGLFEKSRFLELLRYFTLFSSDGSSTSKIIAGYHQFHAVRKAVESTLRATSASQDPAILPSGEDPRFLGRKDTSGQAKGDRRAGVIWHTQGSGKSLLMAFYAGKLIQHPGMENPTLVILTDRNDLDDQLFGTFCKAKDLLRQTPLQADDREDLRLKLARDVGGVIFTTVQKFAPPTGVQDLPPLTTRSNVVVIADEAHRSQYGFGAKMAAKTGEIAYGFAKYLRDALPNASFIGFTGTPIEATDVNTPAVFGEYIDIYDISRAVEDGATVPILYESRLARIELDEDEKPKIDAEIEELTEDEEQSDKERLKQKWAAVEALVGSDDRIKLIAKDLVRHFCDRLSAMDGKAMIVCMSRRICVKLYNEIVALRPDWHSENDNEGAIKIVMTGSASDPQEWQKHIGTKGRRDLLAKRARKASDPLKLVIVRDMWLTGFDAPSMHTMYVDKPMQGHGLMQAIARVNRVFRDKEAGLIVDYIGIAQNLKSALQQYSSPDQKRTGVDLSQAAAVLLEKLEVVRDMFHGFEYQTGLAGTPHERLVLMAGGMEWILGWMRDAAARETTEDAKKKALRAFADATLSLTKAYAIASASDEAREVREEVGFFQAIRAALTKTNETGKMSQSQRDFAVQQIVSRAVISTEIVDILAAVGIKSPDISILSDEFLSEVQQMASKNLALEALKKLLNDSIHSRSRTNVVQSRSFSERLEAAISRYHANAITTAEVIQELIGLARDIKDARKRGDELGLTEDEIAFYDALAENQSAIDVLGDANLRVIAHELLVSLRRNVTVDWAHRENARARMRVEVKKILRKYGYPPDLQDKAVQTVLQQAELLSKFWTNTN
jgi:type I restriction enzyme R subunit